MADNFSSTTGLTPARINIDRGQQIAQKIGQRGMASLLSKTYATLADAQTVANFYSGEEFGFEIGSIIPIIYGEVLIRGYTLDSGQIRSDIDEDDILKVFRFIQGEGPTEGIVGVGQDKLQNVIINCEPVVDPETGKASKHNIGLKEILGVGGGLALMASPYIARLFKKDPVTGQTIPSALPNVLDPSTIMDLGDSITGGTIPVINPATGKLEAVNLADKMKEIISIQNKCCITDEGEVIKAPIDESTPGTGSGEGSGSNDPDNCAPITFDVKTETVPPPKKTGSYKLLPHNGDNKVFSQTINLKYPGTFKLHFELDGLWMETKTTTKMVKNDPTVTATMDDAVSSSMGTGSVELAYCLVMGDEIIKIASMGKSGYSEDKASFTTEFEWVTVDENGCDCNAVRDYDTEVSELRVYRTDNYKSSTDVSFQGISFEPAEVTVPVPAEPADPPQPPTPVITGPPAVSIVDDEIGPQQEPAGFYKASGCGVVPPVDPEDPTDPENPEEPSEDCEPCVELVFAGAGDEESAALSITSDSPRDRQYNPAAPAAVKLPVFTVTAAEGSADVAVNITLQQGLGVLSCTTVAGGSSSSWSSGDKSLTVTGPKASVNSTLNSLHYQPADGETGDITYTARVTQGENTSQSRYTFTVRNQNLAHDAAKARTEVTFTGTTGNTQAFVNGVAISGVVNYTTSIANTAALIVSSINSTNSTPNYSAVVKSGATIVIEAPEALGTDANGFVVTVQSSADIAITGGIMDGGVTATTERISLGTRLKDFALGILPTVGAGLIANTVMSTLAQNTVDVPVEEDEEDPKISILMRGLVVRVPNNYDAVLKTYSGSWDGTTFIEAYTNNPAWCLLDFIESKRYGCGNQVRLTDSQRAKLYQDIYACALRCDEQVNNGRGVLEPRYTINTIIAGLTRLEALDAISGVMHAQCVFSTDGLRVIQDKPQDVIGLVVPANITTAGFSYSGGLLDSTYNYVTVDYNNPDKYFIVESLFVADGADILERGFQLEHQATAFGCTSEGQARRHGSWIIQTEKTNPSIVSYVAGFDHENYSPGDLVYIVDNIDEKAKGTNSIGGRIIAKTSNTVYEIDRAVTGTNFRVMGKNGVMATSTGSVALVSGKYILTLGTGIDAQVGAIWAQIDTPDDVAFKIVSISENSDGLFSVTAVKHDANKYDNIDSLAASQ